MEKPKTTKLVLHIPIEVPVDEVEDLMNHVIQRNSEEYSDAGLVVCQLRRYIWESGPIDVSRS